MVTCIYYNAFKPTAQWANEETKLEFTKGRKQNSVRRTVQRGERGAVERACCPECREVSLVLSVQTVRRLPEARQGLGRWDLAKKTPKLWKADDCLSSY